MSAAAIPAALRPWAWRFHRHRGHVLGHPASSTPTGSSETSHTTLLRWKASATRWASVSECDAQTSPAPDSTISRAWAGPPTQATRSAPNAASSTVVGGLPYGGTRPLASDTMPALGETPSERKSSTASPRPFEGTARNTRSGRSNWSSREASARIFSSRGSATPGR